MFATWLVAAIILLAIEATTYSLYTIWFAIGAIVAAFLAYFGTGIEVQMLGFVAVSAVLLFYTKPIVQKHLNIRKQPTNSDILIGKIGVALTDLSPLDWKGEVKVRGLIWAATSDVMIEKGMKVEIVEIVGAHLVVKVSEGS